MACSLRVQKRAASAGVQEDGKAVHSYQTQGCAHKQAPTDNLICYCPVGLLMSCNPDL